MIGLSFPTLEELPYVPIILDNWIISPRNGRLSPQGTMPIDPNEPLEMIDGLIRESDTEIMIESSNLRRVLRNRVRSARAGVCFASAAAILGVAFATAWIGHASAQQAPPVPDQSGVGTMPNTSAPGDAQAKEKAEEPPTPAEVLIDESKAKIAKLQSCAADLEETVDMLNQHFTIKGRYLKAPQQRVYFRLTLAGLPDTTGTTLQVCDGETLWDYQSILDQQVYHKLSIKPVMERLDSPDLDAKLKEQAKEGMGFAGPETLLAGLRRLFRFDQEKEEAKLGDKAVWIVRGKWKSRQGLGDRTRQVPAIGLLPPYIPGLAILYLGKDDGFPYKLILRGQPPTKLLDTRKEGPDGRKIGSLNSIQSVDPTIITMVYTDVKLNPTLNIDEFVFQAPNPAGVEDGTEAIVRQLDQMLAIQADRKKQEATKKDAPSVLDQPLDIPTPPSQPPVNQPAPK
jgi:outer membrane lipoprotein-sorting protein